MAQHDFNIANQSFPSFRTDLNNFLQAVATSHSGTSLPSGAVAGTIWLDTTSATTPILKYYDGTDNITLATINHSTNTVDFNDSTISTPLAVTGNATAGAEIRLPEDTDNGSNYVALKAPDTIASNLTLTLPATDGTARQALTTSGAGVLSFTNAPTGFRNRIINGDMRIDQRNSGASVTPTANVYTLDRWYALVGSASKMSFQQSTTTATGFFNSALATTVTAYSVSGTDTFAFLQPIEGFNVADLGFGTANAKTVTLSFWVRSSLTGTFGGSLSNDGYNRSYPFTYTISTADTFEYKTITIAGDTSGTWTKDNSAGLRVYLGLGVGATSSGTAGAWASAFYASATGATSVVGTLGATFYITGVQLEAGTSATDFEFLPIDVSLGRCQRYFEILGSSASANNAYVVGCVTDATIVAGIIWFQTQKRATPTITASGAWYSLPQNLTAVPTFNVGNNYNAVLIQTSSGLTAGQASYIYDGGIGTSRVSISAEL